uniref:Synaptosomal-associated protein 47 n=1 Tax=Callorhinchus milii TaxID=7868 RepID=V9KYU1_CALMI
MTSDLCLYSWPGAYYVSGERRWAYGTLQMTPSQLVFRAEKERPEPLVRLELSAMLEVRKETSSLVFSSLTVLASGGHKHWFSSLRPSRAAVFNVLEHFWREQLLGQEGGGEGSGNGEGAAASPWGSPSSKGKELISLATSSQRRLEDTTTVLHHQGEQFDRITKGLDKIESDMDVANRLLTQLESPPWWPFGSRSRAAGGAGGGGAGGSGNGGSGNGGGGAAEGGLIVKVPVLYSRDADTGLQQGALCVLCSGLDILDWESRPVHRYLREEVDEVRVRSPYQVTVRQRFIGRPDVTYHLTSARMSAALSVMEVQYCRKVLFRDELLEIFRPGDSPVSESSGSLWKSASGFLDKVMHPGTASGEGQLQQVTAQSVSESEVHELRQILGKLKSLALDTETELERQDETLDVIGISTDRATARINTNTRRVRKLL